MKNLRYSLLAFLCIATILTLSHCSDDDGNVTGMEEVLIDLTDANALTDAVTILGATEVMGDPPAPSTDPAAPALVDVNDVVTSQGGSPLFAINTTSQDVAGVYLQIPGAESYFDIPASVFTGGRIENDSDASFSIDLPADISPGTFCVDYCIYDSEARVSNIVTVCIEITEFGGENSDFLLGVWQVITLSETDADGTDTIVIGVDSFEDTYTINWGCDDGTFVDLEVTETEFFDFIKFTFSAEGVLRFESSFTETYYDGNTTTCDGVVYIEESGLEDITGAWSYEDANSRLILVLAFDDTQGEEVLDLSISVDGNRVTGTQTLDGNSFTVVLEKQ